MNVVAEPLTLISSVSVVMERSPVKLRSVVVSSAVNFPGKKVNVVTEPVVVAGILLGAFRGASALFDGL
jgi:hypothetical protein